jgi:hypothetical protein
MQANLRKFKKGNVYAQPSELLRFCVECHSQTALWGNICYNTLKLMFRSRAYFLKKLPRNTALVEKLTVVQRFCGSKKFNYVFIERWPEEGDFDSEQLFKINFNVIFPSTPRSPKLALVLRTFD